MDEQAVQATAEFFFDNDTSRQIIGHQPVAQDGTAPVADYDRILKLTIPITIENTTRNNRTVLATSLDEPRLHDIDPIKTEYLPQTELTTDQTLKTWLLRDVPDLNGPQLTGSGRQLINVDDPLLDDLTDNGVATDRLDRLEPVLDAHERDPTARGSHADIILDHRSRSAETRSGLIGQLKQSVGLTDLTDVPSQSGVFQELMAILSERRVAPHLPERQALDHLRRETGGEKYTLALDILDWLRTDLPRRLSYTQITDLLHYCRFVPYPDKHLAHFLADLSHGMPPEDVPYHSSAFDREEIQSSPSEVYSQHDRIQNSIDRPFKRLLSTTFETIRLEGAPDAPRLIKEWWSYDPPAVVAPTFIRHILLLRRLHQHATHNGYSLVRSTASTGAIGPGTPPASAYRY